MKRIIYTCDRCGKEIPDDRYHITITRETADEPELIGESCYQDYCLECMTATMAHLRLVDNYSINNQNPVQNKQDPAHEDPEETEIAPEETIDLSAKTDKTIDPEDIEEPEASVLWELKEMDEKPKRSYSKRVNPETRDRIIELHKNGESIPLIAGRLGVERKLVTNVLYNARKKGLCE